MGMRFTVIKINPRITLLRIIYHFTHHLVKGEKYLQWISPGRVLINLVLSHHCITAKYQLPIRFYHDAQSIHQRLFNILMQSFVDSLRLHTAITKPMVYRMSPFARSCWTYAGISGTHAWPLGGWRRRAPNLPDWLECIQKVCSVRGLKRVSTSTEFRGDLKKSWIQLNLFRA